jgi:glutathione S-transferase
MTAARIFHLTARSEWDAALDRGSYPWSTRGLPFDEVGFVHCSTVEQVVGVATRFFADVDDLVLLEIESDRVDHEVVYEPAPPDGERFPHIYGPLPLEAVVTVHEVESDGAGAVLLPAALREPTD